eukprot:TRINITY_DN1984_c1_g1_i2.p1 TRINITY_DN1984_c1_g1~~TRINITY_DN1984_c1_g1_i2.p1  ORF type:complete len:330 (-),score=54.37 TRINITY_DN1984_c1_g1_i2:49-1038(-)
MKVVLYFVCLCSLFALSLAYENPVVNAQCPDPGVFLLSDKFYFTVTTTMNNSQIEKFPIRISDDLVNWTQIGYIFTNENTPKWAVDDFWAPEIHFINGNFLVYFAARDTTDRLCVGVAVSQSGNIDGPYYDPIGSPLLRNASVGYIDPTVFYDEPNNEYYIFWKQDGNANNPPIPSVIFAQKLSASGTTVIGEKVPIIQNDLLWEGEVVEAPWIIYNNGYYYLFYSANNVITPEYCIAVARSTNLTHNYSKFPTPIVHSNSKWIGPGHCSVVTVKDTSTFELVYHSWLAGFVGNLTKNLLLIIDKILWSDDWPYINTSSPSVLPQPNPL